MKLPKDSLSVSALIAANLAPFVGVLLFGWDAAFIVLLYWTENVIVGFYTVLKIACSRAEYPVYHLGKLFMIPFFCVHFGGFCGVHGLFLLLLLKLGGPGALFGGHGWPGPLVFVQLLVSVIARLWQSRPPGMEWPFICLFLSHGVSFVQNYLIGKEYASIKMDNLMRQPYNRIVLLHVAIIAGAGPVMALGSPRPLLLILVVIKISMDVWLHIKSHRKIQAQSGEKKPE